MLKKNMKNFEFAFKLVVIITGFFLLVPHFASGEMHGVHYENVKKILDQKTITLFSDLSSQMLCLKTADNQFHIGLAHQVYIDGSLEKVKTVFEDFEAYPLIFESIRKTKIIKHSDPKHFLIEFESYVPFPFANTIYQMVYELKRISEDQNLEASLWYQFALEKSKDLKNLDGFALIKKISNDRVLYQELDFLDAHWGAAKTFAPSKIWSQSVEDIIKSDYALKYRVEFPLKTSKEIKKMADQSADEDSKKMKKCIESKVDANVFLSKLLVTEKHEDTKK